VPPIYDPYTTPAIDRARKIVDFEDPSTPESDVVRRIDALSELVPHKNNLPSRGDHRNL
jgi:hypothetical protein